MHKPQFLSLITFFSCTSLFAQPVLNSDNATPKLNDAFKIVTTAYTEPGSSGADVTWDFSGLGNQSQDLTSWVTPASTPKGSNFSEADLAYWAGNDYDYYKIHPFKLEKVGQVKSIGGGAVVKFSDPIDMVRFPMNFENSYKDSFKAEFTNAGINIKRRGEITVTADAYGTVILPEETANDVLRVSSIEIYIDEFNIGIGGPQQIIYTQEIYSWYKPGNHYPIVTISKLTTDKGGNVSSTKYQANPSASIEQKSTGISTLKMYPNPASDRINFSYELEKPSNVSISLTNMLGNVLHVEHGFRGLGSQTGSLDISKYAKGVYYIKVKTATGSLVSRLVKQ